MSSLKELVVILAIDLNETTVIYTNLKNNHVRIVYDRLVFSSDFALNTDIPLDDIQALTRIEYMVHQCGWYRKSVKLLYVKSARWEYELRK